MAACSSWTGQKALLPLPPKSQPTSRTIDNYNLPSSLILQDEGKPQDYGLPVLKVSKNGKLQTRRIAFSPDRRHILVTTHRNKLLAPGRMLIKNLFYKKKKKDSSTAEAEATSSSSVASGGGGGGGELYKMIPLAAIDRIQRGSYSHRFILARQEAASERDGDQVLQLLDKSGDTTCLSIVYRPGNNNTLIGDALDPQPAQQFETLDLLVPHAADYEVLVTVLESLHTLYTEENQRNSCNVRLLHAMWADLNKTWSSDMNYGEFLQLCDKMQVPLQRSALQQMFQQECARQQQKSAKHTDDLSFASVARLMERIRARAVPEDKDPFERLWMELISTDPVPAVGWHGGNDDVSVEISLQGDASISSVAFLSFLRAQQKEYSTSLEEVVDLVRTLSQLVTPEDLIASARSGRPATRSPQPTDRLSKQRFIAFLMADANDLLHPMRGRVDADNMTRPLSHYWINTSHDTYLAPLATSMSGKSAYARQGKQGHVTTDEQTYLAALLRGVRCLELDVWDSWDAKQPVLARLAPKFASDKATPLETALRSVRGFLEQNPDSYPVILKIENHCTYPMQVMMAKMLHKSLGAANLIVRFDESLDESKSSLPSPASMRGKVVIIGKRPRNFVSSGRILLNDDYDADTDYHQKDKDISLFEDNEDNDAEHRIIVGFDENGPIRSMKTSSEFARSAVDLFTEANDNAKRTARVAKDANARVKALLKVADEQEERASNLIHASGLPREEIVRLAALTTSSDGVIHETAIDSVLGQDMSFMEEGLEVHEVLPDIVVASRSDYDKTANAAMEAAGQEAHLHVTLRDTEEALRIANANLDMAVAHYKVLEENARRAAAEARLHQEHALTAKERVNKVRDMLGTSKDQSSSAGTVVKTALTEATISEQRASDAEARAQRAAVAAEQDRLHADDETKKEEDLEMEMNELHHQCMKSTEAAKASRDRVEKAAATLERINEQIKLIERSSQYRKELQASNSGFAVQALPDKGSFIDKHSMKLNERTRCKDLINQLSQENSSLEIKRNRLQQAFEDKANLWRTQAEVAAQARKAADRSSHMADELSEDALEEREAANLRLIARQRAETTVENRGSYMVSFEAQLVEAERAAGEAAETAAQSKIKADHLEKEAAKISDHSRFAAAVKSADEERAKAQREYENAKKERETLDDALVEQKRRIDTNSDVYETATRTTATRQEAVVAYNQALLARATAVQAAEVFEAAARKAESMRLAAKHAHRYKLMVDSMTEVPSDLARNTLFISSRFSEWKKSLTLPNTCMQSLSHNILLLRIDKQPEEEKFNFLFFTKNHLLRVFPSWREINRRTCSNYDPVFAWALGCQLVSTNFHSADENLLIAEGRFRQNGSCGYTLKPLYLRGDSSDGVDHEQKWTFTVLSGFNLPKSEAKASHVNPLVKVSLYSGSAKEMRISYRTRHAVQNGLNPIWTSHNKFSFLIPTPSVSMLCFSVWHVTEDQKEHFMAGAAMPAACIRDGYRSIALFDANHSRTGPYSTAGLFVKATRR